MLHFEQPIETKKERSLLKHILYEVCNRIKLAKREITESCIIRKMPNASVRTSRTLTKLRIKMCEGLWKENIYIKELILFSYFAIYLAIR